jgi:hypothetical protein
VKIDDFGANGACHMEVTGGGIAAFTCSNEAFTKSGFKITTDLSDCQPDGIKIPEIDFCSDQDAVKVTVKADAVPLVGYDTAQLYWLLRYNACISVMGADPRTDDLCWK